MTTTVTIEAHLSTTKEVIVKLADKETKEVLSSYSLQDGEAKQEVVYDNIAISITEQLK